MTGFSRTFFVIWLSLIAGVLALGVLIAPVSAEPSYTINYQGKLTTNTGATVANGTYQLVFKLYTAPAGGVAVWTETRSGGNEVTVTNGLFSVMLGSVTSIASVNFNQPLYLGVTVEADSEMTPRKLIGSVPSAFEARQLGGVASTSFLRSDQADSASSLLTFTGGLISNSSTTIKNLSTTNATTTSLYLGGDRITDFTGSNLTVTANALGLSSTYAGQTSITTLGTIGAGTWQGTAISSTYLDTAVILSTEIDTSSELAALLGDETGSGGVAVFASGPTLTGTTNLASFIASGSSTISRATFTTATTTNLVVGGERFTDLTGTGLAISSNALTVSLGNNFITPDNILSTGQTDEYCLTYETGDVFEWQTCGAGGSATFLGLSDVPDAYTDQAIVFSSGSGIFFDTDFKFSSSTNRLTVGTATFGTTGLSFAGAATTTLANNNPYAFTFATSSTAYPLFRIDTTSGGESVQIGAVGGDVYIGAVGNGSDLIFEESSLISGQGGNTITLGVSGDKVNVGTGVNFGIGTSSPFQRLSVAGNINATGTYQVNGTRVVYLPNQTSFTGSVFYGNGGASISHSSGNDGYSNTGVGVGALLAVTTGTANTAIGQDTLKILTIGYNNVAIGSYALTAAAIGSNNNIAIGTYALGSNGAGNGNVAVGNYALTAVNTGASNASLGNNALRYISGTNNNLGLGTGAGEFLANGVTTNTASANSVYVGMDTRSSAASQSNEIVIGYSAIGNGSNTVTLGSSTITRTILRGNVGIASTTPWQELSVTGDLALTGRIYDSLASAGTNGMILQTTGAATRWIATSSLNLGASALAADSLDFTELQDTLDLDANTNLNADNDVSQFGLTMTSDLSVGARTSSVLTLTQANNVTNDFDSSTTGLLNLINNDTASDAALIYLDQNSTTGTAAGISFDTLPAGTFGIYFPTISNSNSVGLNINQVSNSAIGIAMNPGPLTSGNGLQMTGGVSGGINAFTGDFILVNPPRVYGNGATITDLGNYLDLTRANGVTSGTFNISGDVATFSSSLTETAGTITDSSNILSLAQNCGTNADCTGSVLELTNAGTGNGADFFMTNTAGTQTNGMYIRRNGAGGTTSNGLQIASDAGTLTTALLIADGAGTIGTGIQLTGTFSTNLLDTPSLDISAAGAITGATGITSTGLTSVANLIASASSTINRATFVTATTTNLVVNGERFTDLTGTGLVFSGNTLTASLGTNIAAAEIADGDHGFFTYTTGVAALDTGGLTSANLFGALTNETGSGAGSPLAVFSESPTIVTPTFTTSATVPLIYGGTGAGSSLSLQSTSGNGTSDFIRFLVGNAGATEAGRFTTAGRFGLGTTSPMAQFAIKGSGIGTVLAGAYGGGDMYGAISLTGSLSLSEANFYSSASDKTLFINRPSGNDIRFREAGLESVPPVVFKAGGNVGIGTSTPNQALSLFRNGTDAAIEFSSLTGSPYKWSMGIDYSDAGKFKISSSSALGTNDRFVIDGSGRIGVGTASPQAMIDVNIGGGYSTRISEGYTDYIVPGDPGWVARVGVSGYGSGDFFSIKTNVSKLAFTANNGGELVSLWTAGQRRLSVDNSGNVGVGTTTPNQAFSIFRSAADSAIEFSSASGANYKWSMGIDYSDAGKFKISSSSALGTNDRFVINGNGNVGINNSSPLAKLDVITDAASRKGLIVKGASNQTASIFEVQDSTGAAILTVNGTTTPALSVSQTNTGSTWDKAAVYGHTVVNTTDGLRHSAVKGLTYVTANNTGGGQFVPAGVMGIAGPYNTNNVAGVAGLYGQTLAINGTTTDAYDLYAATPFTSYGKLTNQYGLYIAAQSVNDSALGYDSVTNQWGIYQVSSGDNNYFAGNVGIGDTSPSSLFTVGNGDLFTINTSGVITSSNNITPNSVKSAGQTDEYCLTYESTGTTWEWQTCGGGSSLFTDGGATTYLTASTDNLGIGTSTANQKLTVQGSINLSAGDGGIYFDDALFLYGSTTNDSVAFGQSAGSALLGGGSQNVAIGYGALNDTTTGDDNVAVGAYALNSNITGEGNVAIGSTALITAENSNFNIAIGYGAGDSIWRLAHNNILMGYLAGENITDGSNNILIGHDIDNINATASNRLNIGNILFGTAIDGTGTTLSSGNIGIGTASPSAKLEVVGDIVSKGTSWTARSAAGNNDNWQGISYGNGQFVAVGISGDRVMTSPDGTNWTARSAAGNDDEWQAVTYGNGLFVAVGNSFGTDLVMTSPDGTNWTGRSAAGNNDYWNGVTYGNGLFVAVSNTGDYVMTSPDGITWTARTAAGNDDYWSSVTYGNGLFVAVGLLANDRVMTSPDGITWTARSAAGDNDDWRDVTYGKGLFVAVSDSGDRVMTSPDGITWTARSAAGDNDGWFAVAYGNGVFTAAGASGDRVMTSPDGITWTARSAAGNDDNWRAMTYGNGVFAAAGNSGDYVMTSGQPEVSAFAANNIYQGGQTIFGSVGIGTSTPNQVLTVQGNLNLSAGNGAIYFDDTKYIYASSTNDSIVFGESAGAALTTTGLNNVVFGYQAMQVATTSDNMVAVGYQALKALINSGASVENTAIGYQALTANTYGGRNTAVGYQSLVANTTGSYNNALGDGALGVNTTGSYNNAVGYIALSSNTTGSYNTTFGAFALFNATTTSNTLAIGYSALASLITSGTSIENTAIGYRSLVNTTYGGRNTAVGFESLDANTTGSYNSVFGDAAMGGNTTGTNNSAFGYQALLSNTTGANNVAIGYQALVNATTTSQTVAIGAGALGSLITSAASTQNTAVGYLALAANTYGGHNASFGYQALTSNTTGADNNAFGSEALRSNTTGYSNNAFGYEAMRLNTTGNNNVAIGYNALYTATSSVTTIAMGTNALRSLITSGASVENTALGHDTLRFTTYGGRNTAVGYIALTANTTGSYNSAVGDRALNTNTTGSNNAAFAYQALLANTTGTNNVAIGYQAFDAATSTSNTVAIGSGALGALISSSASVENTAVGYQSLTANTYGGSNTGVGYQSLVSNTTGSYNSAVGVTALTSNTTGSHNIAIGWRSLLNATSTSNTVAIGRAALNSLRSSGASVGNTAIGYLSQTANNYGGNNTALGYQTLWQNFDGSNNTAVGSNALGSASYNASNNIGIGFQAGDNVTTGASNIIIGTNIDAISATASNRLNIGNLLFGTGVDGTAGTLSTGNIGIGTSTPNTKLFVLANSASTYSATFDNDGNNGNRSGILVKGGLDDHTAAGPSTLIGFQDGDGTTVGSITFGSSVTAYNTTSDERLKTNIVDTNVGITQLMQVKVRDFNWKADADKSTLTTGFIAQELAQIYPQAVTIPKNLNDIWMVDYSKLMPLVIAGVQDQQVTVTEQGATLGTLGEQLLETIKNISDLEAAVSSGLSENYHTEDETIEEGELVALATTSDATIRRAHTGDKIFGVVSENAGLILGDEMSNVKPIALTGRVKVKVNDEGGDIEIGDAITISTEEGIGTKATTTTRVIGTALEATNDNTDVIHIYVSPGVHYAWNETAAVASLFAPIDNDENDTLWGRITTLASNFVDGVLSVTGVKTDELCVGDVCVDESTFLKMVQDAGGSGQSNNIGGNNNGGGEVPPPPEPTPTEPPVYGPEPTEEPPAEIPPPEPEPEPVVEAPTESSPTS